MQQITRDIFNKLLVEIFKDSEPKDYLFLENWSSIEKLLVVGAVYDHCEILLTHSDLKGIINSDELFQMVIAKLKG